MSRIAIDPSRPLGVIDRKVFGGFVEHLGRCVYGGLYEEGSPLSDERGFRTDVLGLLRDLRLGTLRWPGGNFASNYHWQDGIGPKEDRPRRPELAWGGEEPNRFGTDEFLAYCAELGTEPYICLNMGTGTLEEALAWVEYCNSAANTYWAARRRDNGHAEPYRVRYWALGNEMYGTWQVGAMSAEEYVREATRWARAIRMLDPGAVLIGCGETGWTEWDRVVIDGLAGLVDYHSVHLYTGSDDYWTNVLQPHQAERAIRSAAAMIERTAYRQSLAKVPRIAYDEWNVWYRVMTGDLAERYTHPDALAVATYLNIFIRHSGWVKMANLAQMVNAIAPIVATPETAVVQPVYYPVLLHARAALDIAVDVHVEGETVRPELPPGASRWPYHVADLGPFTLIDAAASVTAAGGNRRRIAVTLVNRALSAEPARIVLRDFAFDGDAVITTVTAGGAAEPRTVPDVATAHLEEGTEHPVGDTLELTLAPQSFTVVEAPITLRQLVRWDLVNPGEIGKSPGKWLDIRQLTDVSACKLQQYLSRNWHFHTATGPRERSTLMASDRPVPYGIGSDTWPGLTRLAADAAQVARAANAIISSGNDTDQDAAVQRERLQEQLGDLRAAIDYVIGKNALDWGAVNKRRDRKRSLYERGIDEDRPPSPDQRDDDAAGSPGPPPHGHGAGDNGRPAPHHHACPARPAPRTGRRPWARAAD